MSPRRHDELGGGNGRKSVDLKLVPDWGASDPQRRAWLAAAFSLPDGFAIGDPVRHGGWSRSPLTIPVLGPSGDVASVVRFEEERDVMSPKSLRGALADADFRGAAITSANVAADVFYVVCRLATVIGRIDPRAEAGEWIDDYRRSAVPIEGFELTRRGAFAALEALRDFPYGKRTINLHMAAVERQLADPRDAPRPPLLIDGERAWTSARHFGTFVRHDRERAEPISDGALIGRLVERGCERRPMSVWDRSDRQRKERIGMVLLGLPAFPGEIPGEDEGV